MSRYNSPRIAFFTPIILLIVSAVAICLGIAAIGTGLGLSLSERKENSSISSEPLKPGFFVTEVTTKMTSTIEQEYGNRLLGPLSVGLQRLLYAINSKIDETESIQGILPYFVKVKDPTEVLANQSFISITAPLTVYYAAECTATDCAAKQKQKLDGLLKDLDIKVYDKSLNPIFVKTTSADSTLGTITPVPEAKTAEIITEKKDVLSHRNQSMVVEWQVLRPTINPIRDTDFPITAMTEGQKKSQTIHDLNGILNPRTAITDQSVYFIDMIDDAFYPPPPVQDNAVLGLVLRSYHFGICDNCEVPLVSSLKVALGGEVILLPGPDPGDQIDAYTLTVPDTVSFQSTSMRQVDYTEEKDAYAKRSKFTKTKIRCTIRIACNPAPGCPVVSDELKAEAKTGIETILKAKQPADPRVDPYAIGVAAFAQATGDLGVDLYYDTSVVSTVLRDERLTALKGKLNGEEITLDNERYVMTADQITTPKPDVQLFVTSNEWDALTKIQ